MLVFDRLTEVPLSFLVGVPDDILDRELGNSDIEDQMERTISNLMVTVTSQ